MEVRNLNTQSSQLESTIIEVKDEFRKIGAKTKHLILKLGIELERQKTVKNEDICEEIKHILTREVVEGLISKRLIELYCQEHWKKITKPKNKENEKSSFSDEKLPVIPTIVQTNSIVRRHGTNEYELKNRNASTVETESQDNKSPEKNSLQTKNLTQLVSPQNKSREFEFFLPCEQVIKYLNEILKNSESMFFWIHGTIDIYSGKVSSAKVGRIHTYH